MGILSKLNDNSVNKEWDLKNLNYFLNCCSNIETNIDKVKEENKSLQNLVTSKIYTIDYNPKEIEIKEVLEKIKSLGDIYYEYEFESCKNLLNEIPDYILSGDHENIVAKLSKQNWIRTISKNILEQQKEHLNNHNIIIIK